MNCAQCEKNFKKADTWDGEPVFLDGDIYCSWKCAHEGTNNVYNDEKTRVECGSWIVTSLVDDDGHLNVYIVSADKSDIREIETGQGDGTNGEQYALRFTTDAIEGGRRDPKWDGMTQAQGRKLLKKHADKCDGDCGECSNTECPGCCSDCGRAFVGGVKNWSDKTCRECADKLGLLDNPKKG